MQKTSLRGCYFSICFNNTHSNGIEHIMNKFPEKERTALDIYMEFVLAMSGNIRNNHQAYIHSTCLPYTVQTYLYIPHWPQNTLLTHKHTCTHAHIDIDKTRTDA